MANRKKRFFFNRIRMDSNIKSDLIRVPSRSTYKGRMEVALSNCLKLQSLKEDFRNGANYCHDDAPVARRVYGVLLLINTAYYFCCN